MFYTKKILTANELKLLRGSDGNTFKKRLSYQLKTQKLTKIRKWLYVVTDQLYQLGQSEGRIVANSVYVPSYISYETVLRDHGVIFQLYTSIFVACTYSKLVTVPLNNDLEPINIQFQRMPPALLSNPIGIETKDGYSIATLERALCDMFWRSGTLQIDTLTETMIRLPRLIAIADIYTIYKPGFKKDLFAKLKFHGITATVSA